jgi:hypothetical protein
MRYLTIILCAMLLGSCGRLSSMKYATDKVKQTVNACTETTIGTGFKNTSVSVENKKDEGIDTKASTSWDTHMMLW